MGLRQDPATPLFGVVSRLTWQKGMDLLLECVPALHALDAQLALIGAGEPELEAAFTRRRRASARPGRMPHRLRRGVGACDASGSRRHSGAVAI